MKTRRLDGSWSVEVEPRGELYVLPHKVVVQIQRHMEGIIKSQRRDRGVEQAKLRAVS